MFLLCFLLPAFLATSGATPFPAEVQVDTGKLEVWPSGMTIWSTDKETTTVKVCARGGLGQLCMGDTADYTATAECELHTEYCRCYRWADVNTGLPCSEKTFHTWDVGIHEVTVKFELDVIGTLFHGPLEHPFISKH